MKGITKRWIINSLSFIFVALFILIISTAFVVQNFYYNSVYQAISGRSSELVNIFNQDENFLETAREYVEDFPDKALMELMVINAEGEITITSTGFKPDNNEPMPDYIEALNSESHSATWTGQLSSGEKVMAVTRIIRDSNGALNGAIRYVVSLEITDHKIFVTITAVFMVCLLIILFIILSSTYFLRSIVRPVREINETAKRIAQGDFNARIDKFYDDEIGELCDTINYMAGELGTADKMKNDFISSVSHELRTPLTAIKGWAETMQLDGCKDQQTVEKGMNVIVRESERLSGIVEELLDFSRIQDSRMVLMMDKLDIIAELDEAIYMQRERALSEGKHLEYDEPEMLPPVLGDRNRLRQVFINIIDNAIKYTPSDGVITIQAYAENNRIVIIISDSGCGIPSQHLPNVKKKFYKANQTQRGSGIGLAVADEIMKLHNGSLDIDSTEGKGTVVTIRIPTIPVEIEEPASPDTDSVDISSQ